MSDKNKKQIKEEKNKYKRPFEKKEKVVIVISIVLAVITILAIAGTIAFNALNKAKNPSFLMFEAKVVMKYVPEKMETNLGNGSRQMTYIEPVENLEKSSENTFSTGIMDAVQLYYYDAKTNKKIIATKENSTTLHLITAKAAFFQEAAKKAEPLLTALKWLRAALIILDIVFFILAVYVIWGKKYDERMAMEKELNEMTVRKRTGISEEEARVRPNNQKQYKKKKRKKKK